MMHRLTGGNLIEIDEIEKRYSYAELVKWIGVQKWVNWKDKEK